MIKTSHFVSARDWSGSLSLGLTVISMYIVFVGLVSAGFASYIYRTEWNTTLSQADAGTLKDVDNLIFLMNREKALEEDSERAAAEIQKQKLAMDKLETDIQFFDRLVKRHNREHIKLSSQITTHIRSLGSELDPPEWQQIEDLLNDKTLPISDRATDAMSQLQGLGVDWAGKLPQLQPVLAKLDQLDALFRQSTDNVDVTSDQYLIQTAEMDSARFLSENAKLRLERNAKSISKLQETVPLESVDRARLVALESAFVGDMFLKLVSLPTIFLTLLVTIAAGGLGTVVAYSRRLYSAKEALSVSRLFVNVGEGIAAAIAIFLFAGAGMLALTQGAATQNNVELNPYTVAFVAFLSGFMAEDAFSSIQEAGKRLFANENNKIKDTVTEQDESPGAVPATALPGGTSDPQG